MPLRRKVLLVLAVAMVGGSLIWTAGYGLRLRSERYRTKVETDLSQFFELPCSVGGIRGHTFSSREFKNVEVWLPDRRDRVFACDRAIWWERQRNGAEFNELELSGGLLVLGTDRWRHEDYRQVFQSGLGHNFENLNLTGVKLSDFELAFDRSGVSVHCRDTSGGIDMSDPKDGVAHLVAYELGGQRVSQGVRIDARFLPRNGVEVSEFVLTVPEVPLAAVGISGLLGTGAMSGRFTGRVRYLKTSNEPEVWIDGTVDGADLAELKTRGPLGPLAGRLSVSVHGARIAQSTLTHFRGSGMIAGLSLSSFAPLLERSTLSGTATLTADYIDLALGHINRLRLEGDLDGLSLQEWLELWGRGSATGKLTIRINNLDVVNDAIKSADVEVHAVPPPGAPGTIDRELLLTAAEKAFDFTWPESVPKRLLPERVEYAELGMRLLVRDNHLRILGTHGPDGDTILTIRVFGAPVGIIREQSETIDLGPHLETLFERLRSYDARGVRDWWERRWPEPVPAY